MKSYKLTGLTGTTGAGKGQVCRVFADNGYAVIDADILARKAVENPLVLNLLSLHFGDDIVADGKLNRSLLGARAFATKEKTAMLNSITHPFISALFVEEVEKLAKTGVDKIIFDAPQLFESKLNILCDTLIAVTADESIRKARIIKRDKLTPREAEKRIAVQFSTEFFKENCDYIIENNGSIDELTEKIQKLLPIL